MLHHRARLPKHTAVGGRGLSALATTRGDAACRRLLLIGAPDGTGADATTRATCPSLRRAVGAVTARAATQADDTQSPPPVSAPAVSRVSEIAKPLRTMWPVHVGCRRLGLRIDRR